MSMIKSLESAIKLLASQCKVASELYSVHTLIHALTRTHIHTIHNTHNKYRHMHAHTHIHIHNQ